MWSPALVAVLCSCTPKDQPREITERTPEIAAVVDGTNAFAWALLDEVDPSIDRIVSPFSVSTALSMAYAGARGDTARELRGVLGIELPDATHHEAFGALVRDLSGEKRGRSYQLYVGNRVWAQQDYPFVRQTLEILDDDYGAPLGQIDFADDPEAARQQINDWVQQQTQGTIEALLQPGSLTANTRMVLTNAIDLYAEWRVPFDPGLTSDGTFRGLDGEPITASMMHASGSWEAGEVDGAVVLRLPYVGGALAMYVVVPEADDGLLTLSPTPALVDAWIGSVQERDAVITLPRFSIELSLGLREVLSGLGMPSAFDPALADLSGLAEGPEALHIHSVIHRAFIAVDELGTEAGGASAVVIGNGDPFPVYADHPFLFFVRDELTHAILFSGSVVDPR